MTWSPGTEPFPANLRRPLDEALALRGLTWQPRSDGRPRFTNRLALETSPYLLQHAHNPVNWSPSGDEAFTEARRLGRPVFLSIGYSTCHCLPAAFISARPTRSGWCHISKR